MTRREILLLVAGACALGGLLGCSCGGLGLSEMLSGLTGGRSADVLARATATLVPTFTPAAAPTSTPTAVPTATSVPPTVPRPTDTPPPTAAPRPADTSIPASVTALTATPPPTQQPIVQTRTGAPDVAGKLRFRYDKPVHGVGEGVPLRASLTHLGGAAAVAYAIRGAAAGGGEVLSRRTGDARLPRGETLEWDDSIAFGSPGTYEVTLSVCFPEVAECEEQDGDWKAIAPPLIVEVRDLPAQ